MILGQLIQIGKHFCECRSSDFVPDSDERVSLIAYTREDDFLARAMTVPEPASKLQQQIREYLARIDPLAYIIVTRHPKNFQEELPAPVGRIPMDCLNITAATPENLCRRVFLLESCAPSGGYRLIKTNLGTYRDNLSEQNLFHPPPSELSRREAAESGTLFMDALRRL